MPVGAGFFFFGDYTLCGRRHCARADDGLGKPFHLFHLRAALQQEQIDAGGCEFSDPLRNGGQIVNAKTCQNRER